MNDALKMQVSAFVDGELPSNESELLLRRLSQDAELRQLVAAYFAIGRCVRNETELPRLGELRGCISAALGDSVSTPATPAPASVNRWFKPLAGFAVAASVALLALFSLQETSTPTPDASVATVAPYTQPRAEDLTLDELFRHHDGGVSSYDIITELVTLDIDGQRLTEVEPKVEFLSTVELENSAAADDDTGDPSNDSSNAASQQAD